MHSTTVIFFRTSTFIFQVQYLHLFKFSPPKLASGKIGRPSQNQEQERKMEEDGVAMSDRALSDSATSQAPIGTVAIHEKIATRVQ